jgi:hypothetical protein
MNFRDAPQILELQNLRCVPEIQRLISVVAGADFMQPVVCCSVAKHAGRGFGS